MRTQILDFDLIEEAQHETQERHFFTSFEHLAAHRGFRKGVISGYIGSTGCGKSSLMKTLALQSVTGGNPINATYWLSEESINKYGMTLKRYVDETNAPYHRIRFFEESSMDHVALRTHEYFLEAFRDIVKSDGSEIVFIDNASTSRLYKGDIGFVNQGKTVEFLKNMAKEMDIAIVFLAHTGPKVSDNMGRLITAEDIRGSKDLVIQASYLYILQKFTSSGHVFLTLRTVKSRDHQGAFGNYVLKYDQNLGVYTGDVKVEFEEINRIFKARDHLGKR
jgi:hypothetical protein